MTYTLTMAALELNKRNRLQSSYSEDDSVYGLQPPLKWAGGKRWLVPYIKKFWHMNSHRRLVEPFAGGLSISLSLEPELALLNDINPHLYNFFLHLQKGLCITLPMENNRATFELYRTRFNEIIAEGATSSQEAAALFYYLNRTGYNGLCRFNKSGFFNVPFGRYKTINYQADFSKYTPLLKRWRFTNKDFRELLRNDVEESDFVYADPPYDVEFTNYFKDSFSWNDQVELAVILSKHKGPIVASNQATKRILDLYSSLGFYVTTVDAPRRISCNGDRTPAPEMIATKGL